jgi:RNA polymerase sigma factor (sigma-70 family)
MTDAAPAAADGLDDGLAPHLDVLARRAADGDGEAVTEVLRQLQAPMYRLALRFLGHPHDAEDATQEVLVRIVTHLSTFEGRSKFSTWAYTVAVRALLRTRKRAVESSVRGAEAFARFLDAGMGETDTTADEAEYRLLCEETRVSCTYGMLLCLSRDQRAAYLLADVLDVTDVVGADIVGCSPAAFRQRLSRARRTLRYVIDNRCGVVDPANPCRCGRQLASSEAAGILDRHRLVLATHPREEVRASAPRPRPLEPEADQLDMVVAIGDLYRRDRWAAPATVWADLERRFPDLLTSSAAG